MNRKPRAQWKTASLLSIKQGWSFLGICPPFLPWFRLRRSFSPVPSVTNSYLYFKAQFTHRVSSTINQLRQRFLGKVEMQASVSSKCKKCSQHMREEKENRTKKELTLDKHKLTQTYWSFFKFFLYTLQFFNETNQMAKAAIKVTPFPSCSQVSQKINFTLSRINTSLYKRD